MRYFLLAGTAWAQTVPDANPFTSPADLARGRHNDLHSYDRGRSAMRSYRGTLSDAERDHVVAYLVGLRGTRCARSAAAVPVSSRRSFSPVSWGFRCTRR